MKTEYFWVYDLKTVSKITEIPIDTLYKKVSRGEFNPADFFSVCMFVSSVFFAKMAKNPGKNTVPVRQFFESDIKKQRKPRSDKGKPKN